MVILMNGSATIMGVSGLSDDLGVEMETGVSDSVDQTVNDLKDAFDPNVSSVQSLISLALAAFRTFNIVISGIFAAPTMLINIFGGSQLVTTVITVLFAPMYVISTLELIAVSLGNETV